ncbi:hypothetical protein Tco_0585975 [Tanacetum coccineum]
MFIYVDDLPKSRSHKVSDVTTKGSKLLSGHDVLKITPFYKAFQVTADAPEIYMQEFWAFSPPVNKKFCRTTFEKEILTFLASLGHSGDIRKITDVNVNKLHQPWRSFAAIINKCLSGKPSYDSLRLSQAQILWGMYNKKNVDYAYLLWEDFIFQIENKNTKKGNAMYYPRFTKLVVNFVMDKDPSIPRRNKVNWHYARDDPMFTTINVISRNEDTQLYGAILPVALTNEDIRNSESYKEYYAIASGTIPPKTKGSKKKANTDTITKQKPPTAPKEKKSGKAKQKTSELETISEADLTEAEQLKIITKRSRQETHISHASGSGADEGTGVAPGVPDAPDYDSEDDISWKSSDDDQDDEQAQDDEDAGKNDINETTQDDEDDDEHDDDEKVQDADEHDVDKTVQEDDDEEQTESDDDGDDFVHPKLTTHDDDIIHEEETDEDDSFDPTIHTPSRNSSSNDEDSDNKVEGTNVEGAKSGEEATYEEDQGNEAVKDTNTDLDGRDTVMTDVEDTHVTLTPVNPDGQQQSSSVSSGFISNMLNLNQDTGVDDIFQQHTGATSFIDTSVTAIMEPSFTAQINRPPTPHPIVINRPHNTTESVEDNLKTQTNKFNNAKRSPPFLITYGDTSQLKDLEMVQMMIKKPSAWKHTVPKEEGQGKEPASTSAPSETTTKTAGKTTSTGSKTHKKSASQSAPVEEAMQTTDVFEAPAHQEFETGVQDEQAEEEVQHLPDCNLAQQDPRESFDELTDSTFDFSAFVLNRLNVQTLTPELLAGPTFELMKGTCKSLTELEYFCEEVYKATTEKLDWINPEGRQYPHDLRQPLPRKYSTSVTKTTAADYGHIKWIEDLVPNSMWSQTIVKYDKFALWGISHWGKKRRQFYAFATSRESARDVYSKRRIIAVTKVEIVEWHDYKHLDWITIRRDDDVLYKFKEGDFHRLRIQDIEDMLLLLVARNSTNLSGRTIAFKCLLMNVTQRVVIQRRVEDLQLGV